MVAKFSPLFSFDFTIVSVDDKTFSFLCDYIYIFPFMFSVWYPCIFKQKFYNFEPYFLSFNTNKWYLLHRFNTKENSFMMYTNYYPRAKDYFHFVKKCISA